MIRHHDAGPNNVRGIYPKPEMPKAPESTPDKIAEIFTQGADALRRKQPELAGMAFRKTLQRVVAYRNTERAEVGATIDCPTCDRRIVKTAYNKRFCSTSCKDRYHNFTDNRRRARMAIFQ